jgi:hypothetical protein
MAARWRCYFDARFDFWLRSRNARIERAHAVGRKLQAVCDRQHADRSIKGSVDWHEYQVVLEVPNEATSVVFGILLSKSGMVWLDHVRFEIVGTAVPVTAKPFAATPEDPVNLNFEN